MNIIFPDIEPVYTKLTTIAFHAIVNGNNLTCEISEEALQDHFGARTRKTSDLIDSFKSNRFSIENVARRKYAMDVDRWLLVTGDF